MRRVDLWLPGLAAHPYLPALPGLFLAFHLLKEQLHHFFQHALLPPAQDFLNGLPRFRLSVPDHTQAPDDGENLPAMPASAHTFLQLLF